MKRWIALCALAVAAATPVWAHPSPKVITNRDTPCWTPECRHGGYPAPDTMVYNTGFENDPVPDWDLVGNAQYLHSLNSGEVLVSHRDRTFALLGAPKAGEWASINHWQNVRAGDSCVFAVWVKTSAGLTNGYITVRRDGGNGRQGRIVTERVLSGARPSGDPSDHGYQLFELDFATGDSTKLLFYVGLYGNGGDSWVEVDDVTILCDPLGPAESGNNGNPDPNGINRRRPENF